MIYFDNAATTYPKPRIVRNSVNEFFDKYGGNPGRSGHNIAIETGEMVYRCREEITSFFNAYDVENVIFTLNCTLAINMALKGILNPGDHVVISSFEHNAVLRPVNKLSHFGLISYDIATVYENDVEKTIKSFKRLIKKNTKLVVSTHGSNVFGNMLPIKEIGEVAHNAGALFMVDCAQTAGVLPIDIKDMGIDFLCASGHKSLYGLSGTGILITQHGEKLTTIIEGGTGSVSESYFQPDFMPDKLESGTINTLGILSLYNGIRFIKYHGFNKIYSHEMQVIQHIYDRISKNKKVLLYTQYPALGTHLPVLSFNIDSYHCDEVVKILNNKGFALRGGIHCSPLAHKTKGTIDFGTARISAGFFNNFNHADQLCNAILSI